MPYVGKKPADIIATAVDTTTGTFSGDLTVDTSTLYVDSANNRVGIGTTSPDGRLHVHTASAGSVTANSDADDLVVENNGHAGINILSPDANRSAIQFGHTSDNLQLQIRHDGGTSLSQIISDDPIALWTNGSEAMRIDSSGNLLVGGTTTNHQTGSSQEQLSYIAGGYFAVSRSGNDVAFFNRQSSDGSIINIRKDGTTVGTIGTQGGTLEVGSGDVYLQFNGTNDWIKPVDGSGNNKANVDLGTSGARFKDLYLSGGVNIKGSTPKITLEHSNENGTAQIYTQSQSGIILDADPDNTDNGTPIVFKVDGSEVSRYDDNGNLLVGTTESNPTSSAVNVVGQSFSATGGIRSTVDQNPSATFNRKTDDGSIVLFRKDGTTVGNIGVNGTRLFIGGGETNFRFRNDLSAIVPANSDGSNSDADIDLGHSAIRYKDLYLSGGAYLGGTSSANKLDDYEEGTFTATLYGSTTGTGTSVTTTGNYVKVGKVVTIGTYFQNKNLSSMSGSTIIGGLPFASSSATNSLHTGSVVLYGFSFSGFVTPYIHTGITKIDILDSRTGAAWTGLPIPAAAGKYVMIGITYKTA